MISTGFTPPSVGSQYWIGAKTGLGTRGLDRGLQVLVCVCAVLISLAIWSLDRPATFFFLEMADVMTDESSAIVISFDSEFNYDVLLADTDLTSTLTKIKT